MTVTVVSFHPLLLGGGVREAVMVGGLRSTLIPAIGPAVAQLPALSHTWRLFVDADAVSTPVTTVVDSVKLASPGFASPDPLSDAVQATEMFPECHAESGVAHERFGETVSRTVTTKPVFAELPWASVAEHVTVVVAIGKVDPDAGTQATGTAPSTRSTAVGSA